MVTSALGSRAQIDARGVPRPVVLWAIAFAGVVAAAGAVGLALRSEDPGQEPGVHAGLLGWAALPYVLAGLIAWWRRPGSRLGPLMIVVGFLSFVPTLSWANAALPVTIGEAFDALPPVLFLHVFLAFPSGRLGSRLERVVVAAGYVVALGLPLVGAALGGSGPDSLLAVVEEPGAAETLQRVQNAVIGALALAGIGVLAARRRARGRPLRRSVALLVDFFAFALVMIAAFSVMSALEAPVFDGPAFEWVRRALFVVIGAAPIAFLIGLLDARLARSAVGEIFVGLEAEHGPRRLRDALARALGDPGLTLAFWVPEYRAYVGEDGRPIELPSEGSGRVGTVVERGGERVAALVHDAALDDERELVSAVCAAAGIALENERLQADLRARLEELRASRARIVEAGDVERRRLERDLHDGAQQRLVSLSVMLQLLASRLPRDADASALLAEAREELAASHGELRELAQGIHPAVLSDHGLAVALESLATRAPLEVDLSVHLDRRPPPPAEVAAYYVVSEALTNTAKYAGRSAASVDVAWRDGRLIVEVADDGVGGADPARGSGLRGLADRVEALGGRVRVWSEPSRGTRIRAEIPCG